MLRLDSEFISAITGVVGVTECPENTRWSLPAIGTTVLCEVETVLALYGLIRTLKPERIVETGCNLGVTTLALYTALSVNGRGYLSTCDIDAGLVAEARARCGSLPINFAVCDGEELVRRIGPDFAFIDSSYECRVREIKALPDGCTAVVHDTSLEPSLAQAVRERGGVILPGPRGFGIIRT